MLLKIKETMDYLNISRRQLNHLVETKQIPYINIGLGKEVPRLAFTKEALDKFINKDC